MRRLVAPAALAAPALASACSSCARDNSWWGQAILAVMVLFPLAVGGLVARVIHRAVRGSRR